MTAGVKYFAIIFLWMVCCGQTFNVYEQSYPKSKGRSSRRQQSDKWRHYEYGKGFQQKTWPQKGDQQEVKTRMWLANDEYPNNLFIDGNEPTSKYSVEIPENINSRREQPKLKSKYKQIKVDKFILRNKLWYSYSPQKLSSLRERLKTLREKLLQQDAINEYIYRKRQSKERNRQKHLIKNHSGIHDKNQHNASAKLETNSVKLHRKIRMLPIEKVKHIFKILKQKYDNSKEADAPSSTDSLKVARSHLGGNEYVRSPSSDFLNEYLRSNPIGEIDDRTNIDGENLGGRMRDDLPTKKRNKNNLEGKYEKSKLMQKSRDKKMDIDRKSSKGMNVDEISGMDMDMDKMANGKMGNNKDMKMDTTKSKDMKMDIAKSKGMKMSMNKTKGMKMSMNKNKGMKMGMNKNKGMKMGMNKNKGMQMDRTKSKDMKMDSTKNKGMKMGMGMEMSHDEMGMDMDKMKRLMEGYKYHVMLDITSKLMFCWNVNYSNKTVSIRVTCQLPPNYWFGVGFSDYGEVTDADFVVFWNDPVATHHLQDSYTDSNGVLHADHSRDYTLHKARTEDGLSILEYTRPFDTCDERDYLLDNGTTHIVYFVSKGTPASCVGKDVRDLHHGFQRVQLLKPDVHLPPLPADVWTFEITAPKVKIPGSETTYWWFITTLPILHHKHHIVRYEGVIQKENEDIVHHIEVFHCVGRKHVHPYSGPKVPEGKMDPASDLASCRNVIGAWAMGAEPIIYPEEAGSPIGGEGFSPFILLEVHYHNPHLRTGHVDSSGIRFYVSPTLRQYDMGIMELGLEYTDKMAIPPEQSRFLLSGYCIAECTQTAFPRDGINIFASQLHTHLTGKRVWTKHVRNGRELPEVNRDNHYSPHFQEVRVLRHVANILPGDALITECEDSTLSRSNVTYGGFSITAEMCVNYIHYYPKVDLEVCKSSISDNALQNFFYFMNRIEHIPISPDKGIKHNYGLIPWLPEHVSILNYAYQTSPISMQCNQSNGQRFPGTWEGVPLTKIEEPLLPEDRKCGI